ncbi:GATA zinc finger domain containing protein [Acanthamoeba castellanii str. Neff]|uniref:GATA zinc finger domain containing protein n=1 Tax=Acanthamoeba castellanii (strain ATCC 30010 / Neff) TaxID=1257118 RepID=L8GG63_ACACF|nr:GATA zinc finger domain containing protein [Acanthamoeba castellanii str. Neff]ELR11718.1 GATA zinc finger domain containing protein [Acanthamoeba castellanii str. Neff]
MTADKLARMSMAASIGPGLSEADYGLFSRSLEDMSGCIHQLCRAYQLQEPALVPGGAFPDQTSETSEAATAPAAATGEDSEAGRGFKKHRPSNRVRPDKACLECGRRDTAQWRRGPLGVSTLCNACGIRHARVMKKVMRQQVLRLGLSPGCTPPLPDEAEDGQHAASPVQQGHYHHQNQRDEWPGLNSDDDERESTAIDHLPHAAHQQAARSSVYDLLN